MHEEQAQLKNCIVKELNFLAGFTLIEICFVLVIIGIMLTFALPQFAATKEHLLDKDAKTALALIRGAEQSYKLEYSAYYPSDSAGAPLGATGDIAQINVSLKLSLPVSSTTPWVHQLDSGTKTATSRRNVAGGRVWTIGFVGDADPSCSGSRCPS